MDSWIALTNFVTRPSYIGFGFNLKDTVILSNDLSPENGSAEVSRVFPRREDMSNDLQPIPVASAEITAFLLGAYHFSLEKEFILCRKVQPSKLTGGKTRSPIKCVRSHSMNRQINRE